MKKLTKNNKYIDLYIKFINETNFIRKIAYLEYIKKSIEKQKSEINELQDILLYMQRHIKKFVKSNKSP